MAVKHTLVLQFNCLCGSSILATSNLKKYWTHNSCDRTYKLKYEKNGNVTATTSFTIGYVNKEEDFR